MVHNRTLRSVTASLAIVRLWYTQGDVSPLAHIEGRPVDHPAQSKEWSGQQALFPGMEKPSKPSASDPQPDQAHGYAQVFLQWESRGLDEKTYTYAIPDAFAGEIQVGVPVEVPFGHQPQVPGLVFALNDTSELPPKSIKPIGGLLDHHPIFPPHYTDFLSWMAQYYGSSLGTVVSAALPGPLLTELKRMARLTEASAQLAQNGGAPWGNLLRDVQFRPPHSGAGSPNREAILLEIAKSPAGIRLNLLAKRLKTSPKALQGDLKLLRQWGIIELFSQYTHRPNVPKTQAHIALSPNCPEGKMTPRQTQIFQWIETQPNAHQGIPLTYVVENAQCSPQTLERMVSDGWLIKTEIPLVRDPLAHYAQNSAKRSFELNPSQASAVLAIQNGSPGERFLLHGVTGSGKTEVYLALTAERLAHGQAVLILVPEIALSTQIAERFMAQFGRENIVLWHSNLSEGERIDSWRRIQEGEAQIAIGARSAVFLPFPDLGLIVIDEAHEDSYKQDSPAPRYDARRVAHWWAETHGTHVVLGSATPDIGSYYLGQEEKTLTYLKLPERFGGRTLATVHAVDMPKERQEGNSGIFSRKLLAALGEGILQGDQAILLINRRGFHTFLQCKECQAIVQCPRCAIALTLHRTLNAVCCHYCGHRQAIPEFCPTCASWAIEPRGTGSQRVEEELTKHLPTARVLRLDSDTTQRKHAHREILSAFRAGEADILVGTQMVAKGFDIPNVTLVGVIGSDSGLFMPDFKTAERCFQLFTQVAGRAGRGEKPGQVILQTEFSDHPVIQYAMGQDFEGFYHYEITNRRDLGFPPFSQLFRIVFSGPEEALMLQFANAFTAHLKGYFAPEMVNAIEILGPAPCLIPKIQNRFRAHVLLKNSAEGSLRHSIHRHVVQFYQQHGLAPPPLSCSLDVDPVSLF